MENFSSDAAQGSATNNAQQPASGLPINTKQPYKVLVKLSIILAMILLLLLPTVFIRNLIKERAERQEQVVADLSSKWGNKQYVAGPFLELPISTPIRMKDGTFINQKKLIYVMPAALNINGTIFPEIRKRSLYKVHLYRAQAKVECNFGSIDWEQFDINPELIQWKEARLVMGISDPQALTKEVKLLVGNNFQKNMTVFTTAKGWVADGIELKHIDEKILQEPIVMDIEFNGSNELNFVPLANDNFVKLASSYPHPSFKGQLLTKEYKVDNTGFNAVWKTLATQRGFPQVLTDKQANIYKQSFGVQLLETSGNYTKTERVVKYALLFIGLTFGVCFLLEAILKLHLHPLQYLLVGLAMLLFYTLLLSFSEFIGFDTAYLIAAAATTVLIGLYAKAILKSWRSGFSFIVGLATLYFYVYFIIQLEDMALIFGSVALFVLLSLLMYFTRNINWYAIGESGSVSATTK